MTSQHKKRAKICILGLKVTVWAWNSLEWQHIVSNYTHNGMPGLIISFETFALTLLRLYL